MAIQFARIQYVSRSSGGNACHKAAYNQRERIECERTGQVFNFKHKTDLSHHEVILPKGVSEKFKETSYLWNAAEKAERRKDSQVAKESVIALPGDPIITREDRIELSRRYAEVMFVSKGLAVQIDIHAPHEDEQNWHAHLLATTRGFSKDGESLSSHKARESDPTIRKGFIKEETNPGEIWAQIQRTYFEEKGYDLTVDQIGIVAQEHMGPVRMRAHLTDIVERSNLLKEANEQVFRNPGDILRKITEKTAVFNLTQVDQFMEKFVPEQDRDGLRGKILKHKSIVPLYDSKTKEASGFYTTKPIRLEEEKIIRFSERIDQNGFKKVDQEVVNQISSSKGLYEEQNLSLRHVTVQTKGLSIVQGRAGTGKSYTMNAVREVFENSGYKVIGMAPTHAVASDMVKDGFLNASTVHKFLFDVKNKKITFPKNSVVIVDEAAMLGNGVFLELLHLTKENSCKLVLFGDSKQLASVDRGGMFNALAQKYGSVSLTEIQRQKVDWQRKASQFMGEGSYREALETLDRSGAVHWGTSKEEALSKLVSQWEKDYDKSPEQGRLVLANKNVDVDTLNRAIREIRLLKGHLNPKGYELQTSRGKEVFSEKDRVFFTKSDQKIGITNGSFGTIERLSEKDCLVRLDNEKEVRFDPSQYDGLKLGYASTIYKSQGKTIPFVYVLHDKHTNRKLSYVALSRQKENIHIFANTQETKGLNQMIAQVSRDSRHVSSLEFMTSDEIQKEAVNTNTPLMKAKKLVNSAFTALKDKFHRNEEFYHFSPESSNAKKSPVRLVDQSDLLKDTGDPHRYVLGKNSPVEMGIELDKDPVYTTKVMRSELDKDEVKQELINRLEGVVSCLNQTKLHSKTPYEERYGKRGSLRIFTAGSRRGTFDCYETGIRGGDIFALISHLRGQDSFKDALQWGRDFLGGAYVDHVKTVEIKPKTNPPEMSQNNWKQVLPVPKEIPLPTAQEIQENKWLNGKLENGTKIEGIYAYRNQDGSLNFGVYRLRHGDGSKGILPLTLRENEKGFQAWQWKGPEDLRTLYGLEKLGQSPDRDILIVEGEKTTNVAQKLFPEYAVLTWSSGAGAVNRSDWTPLTGKNVVIWPDHDEGGIKAAQRIENTLGELNKGMENKPTVSVIKLPESLEKGWDLADAFPREFTKENAKELIERGFGVTEKVPSISPDSQKHMFRVFSESYHQGAPEIDKSMMEEAHAQFKLIEKLYESANLEMNESQTHHHLKQACYIAKKSQSHRGSYLSSSPMKAREMAMKQALFEATLIKNTDRFDIEMPDRFEIYAEAKNQFKEAVRMTEAKMVERYPNSDSSTIKVAAHTQVCLMALTGNKIDVRPFIINKVEFVAQNADLIERNVGELTKVSQNFEQEFASKDNLDSTRSALLQEILRRCPEGQEKGKTMVEAASKSVHNDINAYQKNIEKAINLEKQRVQERNRDHQLSI
jgi:Ti-type conjugative transfer relaxase TraA